METIFAILLYVVAFFVAMAVLRQAVKRHPGLVFVFGILVGVVLSIYWHWIAGIIGGLITMGTLAGMLESGTKKCSNCGCYDTKCIGTTNEDGNVTSTWKCNKCGQTSVYLHVK